MDQITHDVRRDSWLNIIQQCQARPEGITVKKWLDDNGIKNKAYYYWLRKFRKEAYAEMNPPMVTESTDVAFAEIHMPMQQPCESSEIYAGNTPVAIIKCNGISLEITNGISTPLLQTLIREVTHA